MTKETAMKDIRVRHSVLTIALVAMTGVAVGEAFYLHRANERLANIESRNMMVIHPYFDRTAFLSPFSANPFGALRRIETRFMQDFDTPAGFWVPAWTVPSFGPQMRLTQTADSYQVQVKLPGVRPDDVRVSLSGRLLNITARASAGSQVGQNDLQESFTSSFDESFTLPGPVSAEGMQKSFKDGVLTVTIPRATI
jgi:HSP20 family protein